MVCFIYKEEEIVKWEQCQKYVRSLERRGGFFSSGEHECTETYVVSRLYFCVEVDILACR